MTHLSELHHALDRITVSLEFHQRDKGQSWQAASVAVHLRHLLGHVLGALFWLALNQRKRVDVHLSHGGCRALMALEQWQRGRAFQFRTPAPHVMPTPPQQLTKAERLAMLDKMRDMGSEEEQRETWEYLKRALDEDRPAGRKLFAEHEPKPPGAV